MRKDLMRRFGDNCIQLAVDRRDLGAGGRDRDTH